MKVRYDSGIVQGSLQLEQAVHPRDRSQLRRNPVHLTPNPSSAATAELTLSFRGLRSFALLLLAYFRWWNALRNTWARVREVPRALHRSTFSLTLFHCNNTRTTYRQVTSSKALFTSQLQPISLPLRAPALRSPTRHSRWYPSRFSSSSSSLL